jgi:hypothetical protein
MIRFPNGSRLTRRFLETHKFTVFLDKSEPCASNSLGASLLRIVEGSLFFSIFTESECCNITPRSFCLRASIFLQVGHRGSRI